MWVKGRTAGRLWRAAGEWTTLNLLSMIEHVPQSSVLSCLTPNHYWFDLISLRKCMHLHAVDCWTVTRLLSGATQSWKCRGRIPSWTWWCFWRKTIRWSPIWQPSHFASIFYPQIDKSLWPRSNVDFRVGQWWRAQEETHSKSSTLDWEYFLSSCCRIFYICIIDWLSSSLWLPMRIRALSHLVLPCCECSSDSRSVWPLIFVDPLREVRRLPTYQAISCHYSD